MKCAHCGGFVGRCYGDLECQNCGRTPGPAATAYLPDRATPYHYDIPTFPAGRLCASGCGTVLSIYNEGIACHLHERMYPQRWVDTQRPLTRPGMVPLFAA